LIQNKNYVNFDHIFEEKSSESTIYHHIKGGL